jgi:hypothetical protein
MWIDAAGHERALNLTLFGPCEMSSIWAEILSNTERQTLCGLKIKFEGELFNDTLTE